MTVFIKILVAETAQLSHMCILGRLSIHISYGIAFGEMHKEVCRICADSQSKKELHGYKCIPSRQ